MLSHLAIGSNDIERSRKFYDPVMAALGLGPGQVDPKGRLFYRGQGPHLVITLPLNGEPANFANGATVGFKADSPEMVEAWHAAGVANGGVTAEDPPGIRAATPHLYLAYLRDPDNNKLCAVYRIPG